MVCFKEVLRNYLIRFLLAGLLVSTAQAKYSVGSGTSTNPYLISTPDDMNAIGASSADWNKCFKLIADVNMAAYSGTKYKIIGDSMVPFTGTFDGNGHIIRNFTYTATDYVNYVGLFGYASYATIKNLRLENANINVNGEYVGSLIGYKDYGAVTNCSCAGSVISAATAGGLVGYQDGEGTIANCHSECSVYSSFSGGLVGYEYSGTIQNCYSTGSVTSISDNYSLAGGLVAGQSYEASITDCYSTGSVTSSSEGSSYAGGLIGDQGGTATNCYSTGDVISTSSDYSSAGGLSGFQGGTVENCYSTGSVSSNTSSTSAYSFAGGLIGGQDNGTVISCYSTGSVISSASSESWAGGLIGSQYYSDVTNCYSTGSVASSSEGSSYAGGLIGDLTSGLTQNCYSTGSAYSSTSSSSEYACVGGLIGYQNSTSGAEIRKCYSIGTVSAGGINFYKGGFLGYHGSSGILDACFWDTQTSGMNSGLGYGSSSQVFGRIAAQMKTQSTFTNAGWDFTTPVWKICNGTNYPKLAWQVPLTGDFGCPDGVDFLDFATLANQWRLPPVVPSADIAPAPDGDGIVDFKDFAVFAENWLAEN